VPLPFVNATSNPLASVSTAGKKKDYYIVMPAAFLRGLGFAMANSFLCSKHSGLQNYDY